MDRILQEIVDTEVKYVRNCLERIVLGFCFPLKGRICPKLYKKIFANVEDIFMFHNGFLPVILEISGEENALEKICKFFVSFKFDFLMYEKYCINLEEAQQELQILQNHHTKEWKTIHMFQMKAESIFTLLLAPFQRICRYRMLFEKLYETSLTTDQTCNSIKNAFVMFVDIMEYINDAKNDLQTISFVSKIAYSVKGSVHFHHNFYSFGRFKCSLPFIFQTINLFGKNGILFVFENCILICEKCDGNTFKFLDLYDCLHSMKSSKPSFEAMELLFSGSSNNQLTIRISVKSYQDMFRPFFLHMRFKFLTAKLRAKFVPLTFRDDIPYTECNICELLFKKFYFQGFQCRECKKSFHMECLRKQNLSCNYCSAFL